ncbi:hypothetical protein AVEN_94640-1 [Araneus ventricosus]|uniref:Uncharacterized protein n=1 Tax=Araneus ventricosus TaxID=182803 RepID=A0A4Y2KHP9_ARAVE|nr:hypothetical protein AVEN_94640-1 [Araneus ventricosus]
MPQCSGSSRKVLPSIGFAHVGSSGVHPSSSVHVNFPLSSPSQCTRQTILSPLLEQVTEPSVTWSSRHINPAVKNKGESNPVQSLCIEAGGS